MLLIAGIATAVILLVGGSDEAKAQTVRFQQPVDVGPDPFIDKPADKPGKKKVKITPSSPEQVGAGPFGGTGSDLVCDRDLLIKSLKARPERLAAWAQVLGIEPTIKAVGNYIAKLHPVTLTRDTRVTNHSFVDGQGVTAFQSILAAGTAVLVDDYGNPVARCRCGNPLTKPVYIPQAVCLYCPPRYQPPTSCSYTETTTYRRRWYPDRYYSNARYDEIFIREFRSDCYAAYPDPPIVRIVDVYNPRFRPRRPRAPIPDVTIVPTQPSTPSQPSTNPAASWSPGSGPVCVAYTLSVSGFAPNHELDFSLTRPDGVLETYPLATNSSGSGSYTFSPTADCANDVQGTYNASVVDRATGDSASASLPVSGVSGQSGSSGGGSDLQCDPPRSQLESEKCAAAGQG
ncbi:MAG: hypothetical protein QOF76_3281 [Solirubrobacteraceae bacterium]|nr:hypothetical protein [Solirubrobacteraceae bacterium]